MINKFSFSSLSLYQFCPYCYYLKYICGIKQEYVSSNLIIGKVIHELLEDETRNFYSLLEEHFSKIEKIEGLTKPEIIKEVERLVKLIKQSPLRRPNGEMINLVGTEIEIYVPIDRYVLHGIIDGLTDNNEIIEHKTSSRKYSEGFIRQSNQHIIYEIIYRHLYDRPSNGVIYDILYKTANPIREFIKIKVYDREIERVMKWMLDLMRKIEARQWIPYKEIPQFHKQFCDYKNLCPYC